MRAKVSFEWRDDIKVYVLWGDQKADTSKAQIFYQDPRLNELGLRMISNEDITTNATMAEYDTHRVMLGVPDGSRDLKQELSTLYDGNLDQLNAISLKKGCFLGQELTARIHYRGLVSHAGRICSKSGW